MKLSTFTACGILAVLVLAGCSDNKKDLSKTIQGRKITLDSFPQQMSYSYGVEVGNQLRQEGLFKINLDAFVRGIVDAYAEDGELLLSAAQEDSLNRIFQSMMAVEMEKRKGVSAAQNQIEGEEYLAQFRKQEGVTQTESGVFYKVLKEGTGIKPTLEDSVVVYYSGRLISGVVFDQTDPGAPAQFALGNVIAGWRDMLPLVKEGGKITMLIPPLFAYGNSGVPGRNGQMIIPPGSFLEFDLELLKVIKAKK